MKNIEDYKNEFKKKGLKLTGQRLKVLKVIQERPREHLSAEEIYSLVKEDDPGIGIATVYRTLSLLENMQLVKKIHLYDDYMRYEAVEPDEEHEHHHLICNYCGTIKDIHEDLLEDLEKNVEQKTGFQVHNHRVLLFGTCKSCALENK